MNGTGLGRPGAMQMVAAGVLMAAETIAPIVVAATRPNHEWFMDLTGLPAMVPIIVSTLLVALYFVGFLRYCSSKGYSKWLGFWLFLGNIPGFITLLLLPDLQRNIRMVNHKERRTYEVSSS